MVGVVGMGSDSWLAPLPFMLVGSTACMNPSIGHDACSAQCQLQFRAHHHASLRLGVTCSQRLLLSLAAVQREPWTLHT